MTNPNLTEPPTTDEATEVAKYADEASAIDPRIRQRLEKIWKQAYAARSKRDLVDLYADWSDTYDEDHEAIGYFGHRTTAEVFSRRFHDDDADLAELKVLDAGAGTGAGGVQLAKQGFRDLCALDLSQAMLDKARDKDIFRELHQADLGKPLDMYGTDEFDGVILVGVFSYGQAPAHALEEIVRVTRPGGYVAFTMRTDFHDDDAMGVRSKIEELQEAGAWKQVDLSEPQKYLPKKDPDVMFRVWCFQVLEGKATEPDPQFARAARQALMSPDSVKRLDHSHIWDPMGSRLYDEYIRSDAYYLTECELEILAGHAEQIVTESSTLVELGCGSAQKISVLLESALERGESNISYLPIDVSEGALSATCDDLAEAYGDRVAIRPLLGRFREVLDTIPAEDGKNILFFGSSIGNIESPADTAAFLRELRELMTPEDQLVVGFDLQKEPEILLDAYNAGPANLSFFLHMVRRMNHQMGANFELDAFRLGSTYEAEPAWNGLETHCVQLKVVSTREQHVHIPALDLDIALTAGDAIQVGTSRKFRTDDIRRLAELSGLRQRTLWLDSNHYFAVTELVRDDAPVPPVS